MIERTLMLINPEARAGKVLQQWNQIQTQVLDILDRKKTEVVFTTEKDHGSGVVRSALKSGVKRVIVMGGDGTLSEAIQGFLSEDKEESASDAVLGVIPSGRGDDFFKSISGFSLLNPKIFRRNAHSRALNLLSEGVVQPLDVGKATFSTADGKSHTRYFINIAGFGFPAAVVHEVHSMKKENTRIAGSRWVYVLQGALALRKYRPALATVKLDGETVYHGPIHSGYILNGKFHAGGVCWDLSTRCNDGLFNLVIVDGSSAWRAVANTGRMILTGGIDKPKEGAFFGQGSDIEVSFSKSTPNSALFELDGDTSHPSYAQAARFEVLPRRIKVFSVN